MAGAPYHRDGVYPTSWKGWLRLALVRSTKQIRNEVSRTPLTDVKAQALPNPDKKWEAAFMAVNKNVVTMVRAIKE